MPKVPVFQCKCDLCGRWINVTDGIPPGWVAVPVDRDPADKLVCDGCLKMIDQNRIDPLPH
jgi:hypothetical protein